jgi:hypothetical protein
MPLPLPVIPSRGGAYIAFHSRISTQAGGCGKEREKSWNLCCFGWEGNLKIGTGQVWRDLGPSHSSHGAPNILYRAQNWFHTPAERVSWGPGHEVSCDGSNVPGALSTEWGWGAIDRTMLRYILIATWWQIFLSLLIKKNIILKGYGCKSEVEHLPSMERHWVLSPAQEQKRIRRMLFCSHYSEPKDILLYYYLN